MHIKSPTPTIARLVRARRGGTVVVAALACAALISACGSSSSTTSTAAKNLDTHRVAGSIEESILLKRHLHATVTCPEVVPQEKGATFVCTATTGSSKKPATFTKTPFKVTVQSSSGYVTYVGE
jgi:Domain of unknown function (DUF4333)